MIEKRIRFRLALLACILSLLLFWLVRHEDERLLAAAAQQDGERIEIGATLYEDHCRKCHGGRGEGVGQLGPALADRHFFTKRMAEVGWQGSLEEYIAATTAHGRMMATRPLYAGDGLTAAMPPWLIAYGGPLRDDEIRAIARFVLNWQASALGRVKLKEIALPPVDLSDPATATKAGGVVFDNHCASCHSLGGRKDQDRGIAGPALDGIGGRAGSRVPKVLAADYLRQSVLVPAAFVVEGFPQAARKGCGAILSEDQLQSVVAFLLRQHD